MKIEYVNGRRVSKFLYELSPLDSAIQRYEENIKRHKKQVKSAPTDQLKAGSSTYETRDSLEKKALEFLDKEARGLEKLSSVYAQLEAYRAQGEAALSKNATTARKALNRSTSESHHPTDDLEKYMMAEGVPKPSALHTAHHIVPGAGRLPTVTTATRLHIHRNGIRINDPANGVYLLHKDEYTPHWSMPKSRGHLTYHTKQYEQFLNSRITGLRGMDVIKTQLQVIGRLLQQNEPKTAIANIRK